MCGRYEVHTPIEEIARIFDAQPDDEVKTFGARYNVAPTLRVPVVREGRSGRILEAMTWGLVPSWSKGPARAGPVNARAETVFDKPMFRNAIRRRRCLVPADGFYEWQQRDGRKQPYHVGMADGVPFAMAGIWEYWARPGAPAMVSCALVVTQANELMASIHDRMPVIVAPEDYAGWLDASIDDPVAISAMLLPFPAGLMRAYPVSTRVNNVKNDSSDLIEAMDA
jgi:putative SOS response-associated peptidase YedK